MAKAINAILNRNEEAREERNVVKLEILDFGEKTGSRFKTVIKESQKTPHTKVVLSVREVTYLYDKEVKTTGFEIVEEVSVPVDKARIFEISPPRVVGSIVRDLRTKLDENSR